MKSNMEASEQNLWVWAALILLVIDALIFACGYYLGRLYRQRQSPTAPAASRPVEESLASVLYEGLALVDKRLRSIEGRFAKARNDAQLQPTNIPMRDRLQYAARMAERGNSVDELMDVCKLGRGEAELVKLFHDARNEGRRTMPPGSPGGEPP